MQSPSWIILITQMMFLGPNTANAVFQNYFANRSDGRMETPMCDDGNTLNFSAGEDGQPNALIYNTFDRVVIVCVLPVIVALGLFTNVSFLFVVARVPRMRTVTNLYLVQLAASDLLFLVLTEIQKLVYYSASPLTMDMSVAGYAGSVALYFVVQLVHTETMILVSVVALEKYFAIFKPLHFRAHWSQGNRSRAIKMSIGTWVLSAVVVITVGPWVSDFRLTCIVWPEYSEFDGIPDRMYTLKVISEVVTTYELVTVHQRDSLWYTITFVIIASANSVLFVRIVRALNMRVMPIGPQNAVLEARITRTRNQVAWMLVVNGVIFFVLMAPRKFYDLARTISMNTGHDLLGYRPRSYILNAFSILTYLNSAVNPMVYSVVSLRYRRAFRRAFTFQQRKTTFLN
ncbi:thyrotropin-releasing hormone receptor-like [Patiria miniata]|uniref:G-protein coupled receptors family 1 profile domain-containing protein n=1 Tax=Patiria miniata TaxID=46514 RepID=A0A914A1G7_PATMI|nr:thyrotropin-releasing hormone receptor-like [Patiria miniata]